MSDQTDNKNVIINKTLQILVKHNHLTPAEVAQLRLSHLHLAGKNPSISFTPTNQQEPKVVSLDMETHRALVGWLVNRPDSTSDFLFPGEGDEAMSLESIQGLLQLAESAAPPPPSGPDSPKPAVAPEADLPYPAEPPSSASRPVRPLSRPEMGTPPPGVAAMGAAFVPPPTAPEEEEAVNIPLPAAAPVPPPTRPPASPPPARPVSPPRPPSGPISRPESPPSTPAAAVPVVKAEDAPDPAATLAGAKIKEEATPAPLSEKPAEQTVAAPAKKEAKSVPMPPVKKVEPALAAKDKPTMARPLQDRSGWSRPLIPAFIVIALLCVVCLAGSWYAAQSEMGSQFLSSLGWTGQPTDEAAGTAEATGEAVVFESALPTPTLPPTATATALPPTNTPLPTDTATPTPFPDTPTPAGTDTPTPTDTPEPTDTPSPEEEEEEAAVEEEAPTPTPGLKYPAPEIVEPRDGFAFIRGNTIVLRWKPVELAPNEQYAVRLVYIYQGQPTYQGANIKESEWTVPLSLFGQIDGPDNRYEWFVVVERLNDDGSGTAVSPESQRRTFSWK